MALSLDAIYKPMNDFFLTHFNTSSGSQVLFRFDQFGSVLDEDDFQFPDQPALGYSAALALEKVSDLVNHIPIEQADGLNVVFTQDAIDSTYALRWLQPSLPLLPENADEATKAAMITTFSTIKSEALKKYETVTLETSSGLMLQFKPSPAAPTSWYDMNKSDGWTSHSFEVSESPTAPVQPRNFQLWRLKLADDSLRQIIALPTTAKTPQPAPLSADLRPNPAILRDRIEAVHALGRGATPTLAGRAAIRVAGSPAATRTLAPSPAAVVMAGGAVPDGILLHDAVRQKVRLMSVSDKLMLRQTMTPLAPTRPAETNRISISFEYCPVSIDRDWYLSAFVNDSSWYVPGAAKGRLTAAGVAGSVPLMPIGFIAIRKLSIEAQWSHADLQAAAQATGFGPFKVSADVADMKLSHPGLQIIGWMLQRMPALPPQDPPSNPQ